MTFHGSGLTQCVEQRLIVLLLVGTRCAFLLNQEGLYRFTKQVTLIQSTRTRAHAHHTHARTHARTHTPHVFDIHFHIVLAFTDNSLLFFFSSLSICFNLLAYAYFVLSPSHNLRFVCVILRAQYAQCSCSLRSFLQSPVTSSLSTQQAYELPILAQTSLTPRHQQHTQLQPPVWLGCRQKDANFDCQHVQEFFS